MTPLMLFTLAWVSGIWLIQAFDLSPIWLLLGLPGASVLLVGWGDRRWVRRCVIALVGLVLGGMRLALARPDITPDHVAFYRDCGMAEVQGVVIADPDRRYQDTRLRLRVDRLTLPDGSRRDVSGLLLVYAPPYVDVHYGDRLSVGGQLETPPVFEGFSYRDYLARQSIYAQLRNAQLQVVASHQGNFLLDWLLRFRQRAHACLQSLLPDPQGALLAGILLGIEQGIGEDVNAAFTATGMSHIVAISGYNLTLVAALVTASLRRLSRKGSPARRYGLWISLGAVWAYVLLVGASAAVVRAGVMSSLMLVAQRATRRVHGPTSLAAAVFLMTACNPYVLWDLGFLLSVAAMLALIIYVPPLTQAFTRLTGHILGTERAERVTLAVSDVLIVTLAAQITTLGITAGISQRISIIAPIANLLVLPVQPFVMLFGGLALGSGLLVRPVGTVFAWIAWVFVAYTINAIRWLANLSFADVGLGQVTPGMVVGYYLVVAVVTWILTVPRASRDKVRWGRVWATVKRVPPAVFAGVVAVLILLWIYSHNHPDGRLHMHFLAVGGGEAIFIETPGGRQILVDGGQDARGTLAALGERLPPWDRSLDAVILTSPDDRRLTGLVPVLERYDVALVGLSPQEGEGAVYTRWMEELEERPDGSWGTLAAGTSWELGADVSLRVLWPPPGEVGTLVLQLVHGDVTVLLMGDATTLVEERLVAVYGGTLKSQVLQLARQGDRTCCTMALLQVVRPEVAVVTPRYVGPLSPLVQARLMDVPLYRTDQHGTVEVVSDGIKVQVLRKR